MEQVNPFAMDPDEIAAVNARYPTQAVDIEGAIAAAFFNPRKMVLMDPEDPKVDVNELYQARGAKMLDPRLMNFGCPLCHREMAYELFVQHAKSCMTKWYKTLDAGKRTFAGPQSTNIIGATASAASVAPVKED